MGIKWSLGAILSRDWSLGIGAQGFGLKIRRLKVCRIKVQVEGLRFGTSSHATYRAGFSLWL